LGKGEEGTFLGPFLDFECPPKDSEGRPENPGMTSSGKCLPSPSPLPHCLKALQKIGNSISFTLQKLKMPDIEDSVSHREILLREVPKNENLQCMLLRSLTVS